MQQAAKTIPRFAAKKEPDLDIERWLNGELNAAMNRSKNPSHFWTQEAPALLAQCQKDLEEYRREEALLLDSFNRARLNCKPGFKYSFQPFHSKIRKKVWLDFTALLCFLDYPVRVTVERDSDYDPLYTLETPL
jgi:hypothetical protein